MGKSRTLNSRLVLDSISNGIVAIDSDGVITYFNRTAERIFGIPAQEALNKHVLNVLPNTAGKLLESLNSGRPFYGEKFRGKKVALISNINPILGKKGISGVISVFQELPEIENISRELDLFRNMKNWLVAIIDSSYDGLWICDHEGKVIRINKASERIHDIKAEEVIGKNMKELVAEGLCDKSVTLEVLKNRASVTMLQKIKEQKTLLVTGNPIFDEKGEITHVVTNDRDITELDTLRRQLQETRALAQAYISKFSELEMKGADFSNIVFGSEQMKRLVEMVLRVARTDSTALLLGESGVGKGMVAKLIHKRSERSAGPFIRVDCAGIPDSLIESELFGYEKGAFTGAKTEGKPGFFEIANGGTLFLDEIAELPLDAQSKLLHFLEDHEIIRVGGTKSRKIDVRVIAATNKNIGELILSKLFREDLYYRINVIPLYIHPLRERREDIIPLVLHFLKKSNKTHQQKKVLSPEVIEALHKYDFPGNIRELANLIERLVVITEKNLVELKDLPAAITGRIVTNMPDSLLLDDVPLREALERCENLIIERALKKYGSQREAARALKIDQATVSRKARKYSICKGDAIVHAMMY